RDGGLHQLRSPLFPPERRDQPDGLRPGARAPLRGDLPERPGAVASLQLRPVAEAPFPREARGVAGDAVPQRALARAVSCSITDTKAKRRYISRQTVTTIALDHADHHG